MANAGTVVLLHPPATLVGVSIVQERGCQHFDSTGMSCAVASCSAHYLTLLAACSFHSYSCVCKLRRRADGHE